MEFAFSRQPILDSLAKKSFENTWPPGHSGLPFTSSDYDTLTHIIGSNISPAFYYIGKYWFHVWGALVVVGLAKLILDMGVQMYVTARHQGCGWWIFAGFMHASFMVATYPLRLVAAAVAPDDEDVVGPLDKGPPSGCKAKAPNAGYGGLIKEPVYRMVNDSLHNTNLGG